MIITKIFKHRMKSRHGVNSISELKLMVNSGIDYLKKMELELINLELELNLLQRILNPSINLPFNFLIRKYFFHDNPTGNLNYLE